MLLLFVFVLVFERIKSLSLRDSSTKLGIGTWSWGDRFYWNYDSNKDDESLKETFEYCVSQGVTLFDTAEVYGLGRSELLLGRFNRQKNTNQEIYLATKFAPLPWKIRSDDVVAACQDSLDRLGVNKMQLYQLHWPGGFLNEKYWDGIVKCVEQGLIEEVGVSNYGPKMLRDAHAYMKKRGVTLATNQIQFSLISRSAESNDLLTTAKELNITILAYSPLAQGILTGKFSESNLPKGPRGLVVKNQLRQVEPLLKSMRKIAGSKSALKESAEEISLSQIALNWCIQKGTIPIPGARSVKQAKDNCNTLLFDLTPDEVRELDKVSAETGLNVPAPLQGR